MRLLLPACLVLLALFSIPLSGCINGACKVQGSSNVPIGGDFTLIDQNGRTVTGDSFDGKYRIVYFGYTYCPDVCPTELQQISSALDKLGKDADKFTPIFISVDPARDTPKVMGEYLKNFYPGFVGLTGTADQVAAAAKAYRVYYSKHERQDDPEAYTMDHSSFVYVMDCKGRYITHFEYGTPAEKMAEKLKSLI
ncbi:MAG: redoxin domain-containing protein [Alphaproteobacteria bacterium]|nr:redoxin domain-containing protein [Alphaproteobacteria bacterium]